MVYQAVYAVVRGAQGYKYRWRISLSLLFSISLIYATRAFSLSALFFSNVSQKPRGDDNIVTNSIWFVQKIGTSRTHRV